MGRTLQGRQPVRAEVATHKLCRCLHGLPPSLPRGCAVTCRRIRNRCGSHSRRCTSSCIPCAEGAGGSGTSRTPRPPRGHSGRRHTTPLPGRYRLRTRAACNIRRDTSCRTCAAPEPSSHSHWSTHHQSRADRLRARRHSRYPLERRRHGDRPAHGAPSRTGMSCGTETRGARTMAGLMMMDDERSITGRSGPV
jgi:hypothetical protein